MLSIYKYVYNMRLRWTPCNWRCSWDHAVVTALLILIMKLYHTLTKCSITVTFNVKHFENEIIKFVKCFHFRMCQSSCMKLCLE